MSIRILHRYPHHLTHSFFNHHRRHAKQLLTHLWHEQPAASKIHHPHLPHAESATTHLTHLHVHSHHHGHHHQHHHHLSHKLHVQQTVNEVTETQPTEAPIDTSELNQKPMTPDPDSVETSLNHAAHQHESPIMHMLFHHAEDKKLMANPILHEAIQLLLQPEDSYHDAYRENESLLNDICQAREALSPEQEDSFYHERLSGTRFVSYYQHLSAYLFYKAKIPFPLAYAVTEPGHMDYMVDFELNTYRRLLQHPAMGYHLARILGTTTHWLDKPIMLKQIESILNNTEKSLGALNAIREINLRLEIKDLPCDYHPGKALASLLSWSQSLVENSEQEPCSSGLSKP